MKERMLVDLSQWLVRVLQYSPGHPSCAPFADTALTSLRQALTSESPIEIGVLKDDLLFGEQRSAHPGLRARLAPYLHERGVLVLRFASGATRDELGAFVELLAQPAQAIFDGGGLLRQMIDRGISHVQVEEIAHDITEEEREEHRRRKRLNAFFREMLREMLARRAIGLLVGDRLAELLDHPDLAVAILEEDVRGTAEAAAVLALMVQQEEVRSGATLDAKLRAVLCALSREARDRLLLGFPALVGELRQALAWAMDGFSEEELARFMLPSIRGHAEDLDEVLYALSVLAAHDGKRLSALRLLALALHDLPADEPSTLPVLEALAQKPPDHDSYRRERACLALEAQAALEARRPLLERFDPSSLPPQPQELAFDGRASVRELVIMAGRMKDFDRFASKVPDASAVLTSAGAADMVEGLVMGLRDVAGPWQVAAETALAKVASLATAALILEGLDRRSAAADGKELEDMLVVAKLLAAQCPAAVFERLERSESRRMRRILLEALPEAGPKLLPILRSKLRGASWFVARNIAALLPRAGGSSEDLEPLARHANEKVRLEVTRALRSMPLDPEAMSIVVRGLTDESPEVALGARALLRGEAIDPSAVTALFGLALDEQQPEELRRSVIRALGNSRHDAAAEALFKILQPRGLFEMGSSSSLRELAAVAPRRSPAPGAAEYFAQGLRSSAWRVRKACERADQEA